MGGQVGHREVASVGCEEGGGPAGAVGVEPVPDDQERPADLAAEVSQGSDHRAACDAAPEVRLPPDLPRAAVTSNPPRPLRQNPIL